MMKVYSPMGLFKAFKFVGFTAVGSWSYSYNASTSVPRGRGLYVQRALVFLGGIVNRSLAVVVLLLYVSMLVPVFAVVLAEGAFEVIYRPGDWLTYRYDYSEGPCYLIVKYNITEVGEGYAVFKPVEINGTCPEHDYMFIFPTGYPRAVTVDFDSGDDTWGFYPVVSPRIHGDYSRMYTAGMAWPYTVYWVNYTYYKGILVKRVEAPDPMGRTSERMINHNWYVDLLNITLIDTSIRELRRIIGLSEETTEPATPQAQDASITTVASATLAVIAAATAIYIYRKRKRKQ